MGKTSCGLACTKMLLQFYGKYMSEHEIIVNSCSEGNGGIYPLGIASMFKNLGFVTETYSYDCSIFKRTDTSRADIEDAYDYWKGGINLHEWPNQAKAFVLAKEGGVSISLAIPDIKIIQKYLDKGVPTLVSLSANILHGDRMKKDFDVGPHAVVATGYDEEFVYFADPAKDESVSKCEVKLFEFAMLVRSVTSSAWAVAVKKN